MLVNNSNWFFPTHCLIILLVVSYYMLHIFVINLSVRCALVANYKSLDFGWHFLKRYCNDLLRFGEMTAQNWNEMLNFSGVQDWCWGICIGRSQKYQQVAISPWKCNCCTGRWTGWQQLLLGIDNYLSDEVSSSSSSSSRYFNNTSGYTQL